MKNRIQQIMEREGMTPGRFADSIGIQRSALSHILNGRNNPSLDVIMKILSRFDYLSTDWLMFDKGPMFKHQIKKEQQDTHLPEPAQEPRSYHDDFDFAMDTDATEASTNPVKQDDAFISDITIRSNDPRRRVARIMIFYSDNTFDNFIPE